MKTQRVVLADDHTLVRAGLRKLLETIPNIAVVGETDNGLGLLKLAEQLQPDLILTDIAMPGLNGIDATARITENWPNMRVLILSMHQNEAYVREALRQGAAAYLLKDAAMDELELALDMVVRGGVFLSAAVSKGVVSDYVQRLRTEDPTSKTLTLRQREVLQLVVEGQSTKEIARLLDLSVKTVDTHRTQMMKQLNIHEITGLVRYAIRCGLISADN